MRDTGYCGCCTSILNPGDSLVETGFKKGGPPGLIAQTLITKKGRKIFADQYRQDCGQHYDTECGKWWLDYFCGYNQWRNRAKGSASYGYGYFA